MLTSCTTIYGHKEEHPAYIAFEGNRRNIKQMRFINRIIARVKGMPKRGIRMELTRIELKLAPNRSTE
jgi:hypothetical protein